jgi:RimJ/RimL family protein N-acetyltransferase
VNDQLRTDRLLLRRWRPEDRAPFARMNADPEVVRYLGHPPLTTEQSDGLVDRLERHWATWGYGQWAVEEPASGEFIGFVGLSHHNWYPDDVEVGWRLRRDSWGGGLATEGARAVVASATAAAADGGLGLQRLISVIHRDNVGSRRVAEKNGFTIWREETRPSPADGTELPIVVYETVPGR